MVSAHPFWTIFFILTLIGLFSLAGKSPSTSSDSSDTTSASGNANQEAIVLEPDPIELSGTDQEATQKFNLENGLSVFEMTYSGTSNFAVWLLDINGEKLELLVNMVGIFDGSKAVGITTKGEYLLDISASGSWTVRIEQPRPASAASKPQAFTGIGQAVSEFINLDKGLATFKMTHSGDSNFAVWLLDKYGDKQELLVNEVGKFDGSKAVGVSKSGFYILDISADGEWGITVE